MKKLFLFCVSLLLSLAVAQVAFAQEETETATTYEIVVNKDNGYQSNNDGGYSHSWIGNTIRAGLTLSNSADNIGTNNDGTLSIYSGGEDAARTYTLTAPEGCVITRYTISATAGTRNTSETTFTVTPDGGAATSCTVGQPVNMDVTVSDAASTTFVFDKTQKWLNNMKMTVTIKVENPLITLNWSDGTYSWTTSKVYTVGEAFAPAMDFYTNVTLADGTPTTVTASMDNQTYNVTCTSAFPFEKDKYYYLKIKGDNYVKYESDVKIAVGEKTEGLASYWKFDRVDGTPYGVRVVNALVQKQPYVSASTDGTPVVFTEEGMEWKITKNSNGFNLEVPSVSNACMNYFVSDGMLKIYNNANDQGSCFTLGDEVTFEAIEVTYQITDKTTGNVFNIIRRELIDGTASAAFLDTYYYPTENTTFAAGTDLTISETNKEFEVTTSSNLPVEVSLSGDDATEHTWYILNTTWPNDDTPYYWARNSDTDIDAKVTLDGVTSTEKFKDYAWRFEKVKGNPYGVKIINHYEDKELATDNGDNQALGKLLAAGQGVEWVLADNTGDDAGFNIHYPGDINANANIGNHIDGKLGIWNSSGSVNHPQNSTIATIIGTDNILDEGIRYAEADLEAAVTAQAGYVNGLTAPDFTNLQAATTVNALDAAVAEIEAGSRAQLDPKKVYQLIGYNGKPNELMYSEPIKDITKTGDDHYSTDTRQVKHGAAAGITNEFSAMWQFEASSTSGEYYLKNINSDTYMGTLVNDTKVEVTQYKEHAPTYSLQRRDDDILGYQVKAANNAGQYLNRSGKYEGYVAGWGGMPDNNSGWKIKEVTSITQTIGTTGWATVTYPFAVVVPEGVTAYHAASVTDAGALQMATVAKAGEVVAADVPMFLVMDEAPAAAQTFTMTLSMEEGNKPASTLTYGPKVREIGYAAGAFYALAKNGENGVVLRKNGTNETSGEVVQMPHNKAFVLAKDIPASQAATMLFFDFNGGDQTGIAPIQPATEREVKYYDLNGRRVLYPTSGIYVTDGGQKVYIQ